MFARRHPFLFFLLCFFGMAFGSLVLVMGMMFFLSGRSPASGPWIGDGVGVVEVKGIITSSKDVIEQIRQFRDNPSIKAVVVRVDSPGGAVGPAQEIYREIIKTKKTKKVVASMGTVAASGGYYIASAADSIFANPGTLTGSIGVIMSYTNLQELFEKIGLSPVVIKSGKYKDIGSPTRPLKEDEKRILQQFADDIHQQFIDDVAKGRGMKVGDVRALADGRIYTGRKALELGLVDNIGNFYDALEYAGQLGGIKGRVVPVYLPEEKNFSLIRFLFGSDARNMVEDFVMDKEGAISGGYLYRPGM